MQNEIIINAELGETRVALLEGGQFAELHIERERDRSVTGNVVKGVVSRVLPGMQAAFVDIGLEKAAFLYVGDYFESVLETGETDGEPGSGGRGKRNGRGGGRGGRSAPPRIDTVLHEGKEIVVQIAKEPIGTKGARITSSISIPGRHLVLTPWSRRVGVSRRIGSDKERRRLREIVERLRPQNLGFIIRTAGDGVREADLQADIRYLATVWAAIQQRHAEQPAPAILYSEHDLPLRIVRDLAGHDTKRIVADEKNVYESIQSFVDRFVADPKPRIEHYDEGQPVFERHDLERQIHANLERKVWLKSGGSLVIDKSEALTAIDVNTGRFVGKRDLEETVLKTNLEAVEEVVHQLRFRNLGGLIIIDLIDMESAGNREKVYRALQEALRADKARTNILKISELGLVEMTRKRTRENLVQTLCEPCGYCEGRSYILSRESVAFRVLREIKKHMPKLRGRPVAIAVNPHVAEELLTQSKAALAALNEEIGCDIEIRARPGIHQEQFELTVLEQGPPVELELAWLQDRHPDADGGSGADGAAKKSGRRRSRGGRGRSASPEESIVAKGEIPDSPESSEPSESSKSAESTNTDSQESLENATEQSEKPGKKVRAKRANGASKTAVEATPPAAPKRAPRARGKYETLDDPWDDDPEPPAGPASDLAASTKAADIAEATDSTDSTEGSPPVATAVADDAATSTAADSEDAEAAPDAHATPGPDTESDETPQTVDAEAESRIIPRSE